MSSHFGRKQKTFAALTALALAASMPAATDAAARGQMKTVNGVSYWDIDPGPIDPGAFWTSGQYKYDPHGYMDINRWDTGIQVNTVYADHAGKANCVFRQRVVNTDWDRRHPYLRVCRRPE